MCLRNENILRLVFSSDMTDLDRKIDEIQLTLQTLSANVELLTKKV